MSGKSVIGGLAMLALGLAGGWLLRDRRAETPPFPENPSPTEAASPALARAFRQWSAAGELEGAAIGFCVLDEKGRPLYRSPLAETALCPASALKTLTAGAAFGILGESFRFETSLVAAGGLSSSGVVAGNLVLRGGGDPTLTEDDLSALALAAVERGLKRVEGSLVVDASIFPQDPVNDHWVWGDLGNAYGAGAFGLNVGHNVVRLSFNGGPTPGAPAAFLGSSPALSEIQWDVEVSTGPPGSGDGVMIYASPYGNLVRARGTVPPGARNFTVRGAIPDPPRLAADLVKTALSRHGVAFGGKTTAPAGETAIARHESAPLPEIIDHMQKVSDNLEAQCLFLTMGARRNADPAAVLRAYWQNAGVPFKGLRLLDGSGLARATMIRPIDLALANHLARHAPFGDRYLASLPPGGDAIRSKRGAMSGVKTETGFITRNGREYTFALMANGLGNVDFWQLRAALLEEIGR